MPTYPPVILHKEPASDAEAAGEVSALQRHAAQARRGASSLLETGKSWAWAGDLDEEALQATVVADRRRRAVEAQRSHAAELRKLRGQVAEAAQAGHGAHAERLQRGADALAASGPMVVADDEVTSRDVSRKRAAIRFSRCAMVAAGAYGGGLYVLLPHPLLLIGALLGGGVTAWSAGREKNDNDKESSPVAELAAEAPNTIAAAAQATDSAKTADQSESVQVRGADDLITALVKARVIDEADREETRIIGLRSDGPGWTATIELPAGRTAEQAISRLTPLASALKVKASRIEMSADSGEGGHDGRFAIWVADADNPFGGGKNPSPLIAAPSWEFWRDGVPLGQDARHMRQILHLMWSSLLVGGLQDYGKSYLTRLIAAAAALDPYVRIIVITGKSGPDWAALKKIAHAYVSGAKAEDLAKVHEVLDDLIASMQNRGDQMERLSETDPQQCPEGKLTPELARQPDKMLTLLIVDELQELLDAAANTRVKVVEEDEDGKGGKSRNGKDVLVETLARYVRVARFVGGMGVFVTQRPDADSVPAKLRGVCVKRACFRVKGLESAKMVLGDEAVAAGATPHKLLEHHKGVVVLDQGAESGHVTQKSDVIELPEFREIVERGYDLRVKSGTLSGQAASRSRSEEAAALGEELRRDAVTVFDGLGVPETQGLTAEALAEALRGDHPVRYAGLAADALRERLRRLGITTAKIVSFPDRSRQNGYKRAQLAPTGASEAA
jgi:hypothetical protein